MTALEIILLILGVIIFVGSFIVPESKSEMEEVDKQLTQEQIQEMLKEEVKTGSNDDRRIILTYGGPSFITILEEYITPYETLKTEYVDGDLYVLAGVVAVVGEDTIKFYEAGIEYTLASTNTEKTELVWIGDSLRMSDEK